MSYAPGSIVLKGSFKAKRRAPAYSLAIQ